MMTQVREDSYRAIIASASGHSSCHAEEGYQIVSNPVCHVCGAPWHHQKKRVPDWMYPVRMWLVGILLVWSTILTVRMVVGFFGIDVGERPMIEVLAHIALMVVVVWITTKTKAWPWQPLPHPGGRPDGAG